MDPVKVGVIGFGKMGSRHVKDANESDLLEVVAVADLRSEAQEQATELGVPRVYGDGRELIEEDPNVEAVVIAFPAGMRTAMALRAFARGKHVLLEKPVAMNAREVETMIAAKGDLVGACFSCRCRFGESAKRATDLVASGALGDLRNLHIRSLSPAGPPPTSVPPPWRQSFSMNAGGILTNWGCYDLDYVLGVTGWRFRPKVALAQTWPIAPQFRDRVAPEADADSYFNAFVLGEDGCVLTFERGEFLPAERFMAWEVIGEQGSLYLDMVGDEKRIVHVDSVPEEGAVTQVLWEGPDTGAGAANKLILEDFALAIREGRPTRTSLENSLLIARITDAIYASAECGDAVEC